MVDNASSLVSAVQMRNCEKVDDATSLASAVQMRNCATDDASPRTPTAARLSAVISIGVGNPSVTLTFTPLTALTMLVMVAESSF